MAEFQTELKAINDKYALLVAFINSYKKHKTDEQTVGQYYTQEMGKSRSGISYKYKGVLETYKGTVLRTPSIKNEVNKLKLKVDASPDKTKTAALTAVVNSQTEEINKLIEKLKASKVIGADLLQKTIAAAQDNLDAITKSVVSFTDNKKPQGIEPQVTAIEAAYRAAKNESDSKNQIEAYTKVITLAEALKKNGDLYAGRIAANNSLIATQPKVKAFKEAAVTLARQLTVSFVGTEATAMVSAATPGSIVAAAMARAHPSTTDAAKATATSEIKNIAEAAPFAKDATLTQLTFPTAAEAILEIDNDLIKTTANHYIAACKSAIIKLQIAAGVDSTKLLKEVTDILATPPTAPAAPTATAATGAAAIAAAAAATAAVATAVAAAAAAATAAAAGTAPTGGASAPAINTDQIDNVITELDKALQIELATLQKRIEITKRRDAIIAETVIEAQADKADVDISLGALRSAIATIEAAINKYNAPIFTPKSTRLSGSSPPTSRSSSPSPSSSGASAPASASASASASAPASAPPPPPPDVPSKPITITDDILKNTIKAILEASKTKLTLISTALNKNKGLLDTDVQQALKGVCCYINSDGTTTTSVGSGSGAPEEEEEGKESEKDTKIKELEAKVTSLEEAAEAAKAAKAAAASPASPASAATPVDNLALIADAKKAIGDANAAATAELAKATEALGIVQAAAAAAAGAVTAAATAATAIATSNPNQATYDAAKPAIVALIAAAEAKGKADAAAAALTKLGVVLATATVSTAVAPASTSASASAASDPAAAAAAAAAPAPAAAAPAPAAPTAPLTIQGAITAITEAVSATQITVHTILKLFLGDPGGTTITGGGNKKLRRSKRKPRS